MYAYVRVTYVKACVCVYLYVCVHGIHSSNIATWTAMLALYCYHTVIGYDQPPQPPTLVRQRCNPSFSSLWGGRRKGSGV